MSSTYDIAGVLPDGMLEKLPAGTSLLISGPPMVGKQELAIRLLAAGHERGNGVLCVTTSKDAASFLNELERQIPTLDRNRIGVVDCSGSDHQRTIDEIATESVASPGDLTGVSIGTAKLLKRFTNHDISGVWHGFVSVSTLLRYVNLDTVFKFLHIYTSRIADTRGIGIFTVDSTTHGPQEMSTVMSEFDRVLELRETDTGDREIRVKEIPGPSRDWYLLK